MKIAFVALSGLRAHDPKLLALGMRLPAVMDRARVIVDMPSLGLLYLAALTPAEHDVRYFEVPDERALPPELFESDLVAMSALSAQAFAAYKVADLLRQKGVRVIIGGLHASVRPEEALQHADAVVVGEAENVWPHLLAAVPTPGLNRIWRASEFPPVNIRQLPIPRYDLLDLPKYHRFPVQTSRGCPWLCDFCASGVMLRQAYRRRPVEDIVRDISAIKALRRRPFIEFADDNTFVDKAWGKRLCQALMPLGIKWFTETDVSVADDHELLTLMKQSGCKQVLVGLESPSPTELNGIEMKHNFKAQRFNSYRESIRRIQDHGISVNGCFVLGLDGQTPDVFQQVYDFAMETSLFEVQLTVLTPFPGTPLYDRLLREGRLLLPDRWDLCTLFDVNFVPQKMTPDQLRGGLYWLAEKLFRTDNVVRRQTAFFERQAELRGTAV